MQWYNLNLMAFPEDNGHFAGAGVAQPIILALTSMPSSSVGLMSSFNLSYEHATLAESEKYRIAAGISALAKHSSL